MVEVKLSDQGSPRSLGRIKYFLFFFIISLSVRIWWPIDQNVVIEGILDAVTDAKVLDLAMPIH